MESLTTSLVETEWIFILIVGIVLLGASSWACAPAADFTSNTMRPERVRSAGCRARCSDCSGCSWGSLSPWRWRATTRDAGWCSKKLTPSVAPFFAPVFYRPSMPKQVKELLRRYLDVRLEFRNHFNEPAKLAEALRASADIENAIWAHAEAVAKESPTSTVVSFISALDNMICTGADRVAAGRNHIPSAVWLLVVVVAAFGCYTSAYGSGAHGARSNFTSLLLPLLLTIVIGLIFDIDHTLQGMVKVSQQPLLELRENISR